MAHGADSTAGAGSVLADYDAICQVVQLFVDGEMTGDVAKLQAACHADGRLFGSLAGQRLDLTLTEYIALAAKEPAGAFQSRILSVLQTGDAAVAVLADDGCWGSVSFLDYLSLSRIDGKWKIVNKLFAHTGGEPPAFGA
jgi:Putative lumazine-binding